MIFFAINFEGDDAFFFANSMVGGEDCSKHTRNTDNSFCSEIYFDKCISYKSNIQHGFETYVEGQGSEDYSLEDANLQSFYPFFKGLNITQFFSDEYHVLARKVNFCGQLFYGNNFEEIGPTFYKF